MPSMCLHMALHRRLSPFSYANQMKSHLALDISIPRYISPIMHHQHAFIKHIRRARLTSVVSAPVRFTTRTALYTATNPNNALHALLKHTIQACWAARV